MHETSDLHTATIIESYDIFVAVSTTPIFNAAQLGDMEMLRKLLENNKYNVDCIDSAGMTPLHYACSNGHLNVIKMLILEFKANVNCTDSTGPTPLHSACSSGHLDVVKLLISEFKANANHTDSAGKTALHYACSNGNIDVVKTLVLDFKANVNCADSAGKTLLHNACSNGHLDVAKMLILEFKANVNCVDSEGQTPLHYACSNGHLDVVKILILDFKANVNCINSKGQTPLHCAIINGRVNVVKTLLSNSKADVTIKDDKGNTALMSAALAGHESVVHTILSEQKCPIDAKFNTTLLHLVCKWNNISLVRVLIHEYEADFNIQDAKGNTPLMSAALAGHENIVHTILSEQKCLIDATHKATLLQLACKWGNISLVHILVYKHKADVNVQDTNGDTALMSAVQAGHESVVHTMLTLQHCLIDTKFKSTLLHLACKWGNISLVRVLLHKYEADVNVRDTEQNTPLHVAARHGHENIALVLVNDFGCNANIKGYRNRSVLHSACAEGRANIIRSIGKSVSLLVVDDNGDTPLHTCSAVGNSECVKALLHLNAPMFIRNNSGKTPKELAPHSNFYIIDLFDKYVKENKNKIFAYYDDIQKCAAKKYSSAEPITRIFVIGNPGAGKSSLVETLKREALFDSFKRVSEFSVPPHTAGIIPSIHTSKHYGRVLFYDFAGDPEYYSSHAAILENLASSRKGDNIFIIVVDLRTDSVKINLSLNYWFSFIQNQKFGGKEPALIVIGSHTDLMTTQDITIKEKSLKQNCAHFLLNCCKPKSRQIGEIQKKLISFTTNSPSYRLSLEASMLLGLLEKDFNHVTACSIQTLLSHIEITGVALPTRAHSLHPILYELHEIGLLFVVNDSKMDNIQVVLDMSQLTNKVHQLLFSKKADVNSRENCENKESFSSFNIGIIPVSVLQKVLPEYITKECLVQLQYCQEISHKDVGAFPFLKQSNSTDQSFLFFPALCSIDKTRCGVSWITPPDLGYHIGWLARCTDSCDYFPPRFLHVLLLRLVFGFTVSIPSQKLASNVSFDYNCFKRSCKMWKTGVHWLMEQGVECLVELVNNKEVIVLTKIIPCKIENGIHIRSNKNRAEFCATVFTRIISCVMEAKAEFCQSIRPDFFLLDSISETDYLNPDNLFAMSSVERILASPEGKEVIVSVTGMRYMELSKLLCMRKLTLWYSLFPIDLTSVLSHLKDIVKELFDLGLYLNIPPNFLKTLEANFPTDIKRRRTEVILEWMNSPLDPPCWWHLMQALTKIERSAIAEEVRKEHSEWGIKMIFGVMIIIFILFYFKGVDVQFQEKLLNICNFNLKLDQKFLEVFSGIVGSKWPSLAFSLSLCESEIEELMGGSLSQQDYALQTLMKWVEREDATYGQLCQKLKTISLFSVWQ